MKRELAQAKRETHRDAVKAFHSNVHKTKLDADMKQRKIVSLGEVLWDLFPDGEQFGGAPANVACHAAILGADVAMVSAVGNDRYGQEAIEFLRNFGIDTSQVQTVDDATTGKVSITLDANGKPTFEIHKNSAWDQITWNRDLESLVTNADAVYFGTLGQRSEVSHATIRRAVETARSASIPRVLDINLRAPFFSQALIREAVELASHLKLSDEELPEVCAAFGLERDGLPEMLLGQIRDTAGLEMIVMTCGAKGAVLATPDSILKQSGMNADVRDTVGAGDSFVAAFMVGLLHGEPLDEILRQACKVAAATCSHAGAVPKR